MKLFTALSLLSLSSVSGFSTHQPKAFNTQLRADIAEPMPEILPEPESEPEPELPKMSQSMPFMERPAALTGALAGDVGFDPLGLAKTEEDLMNFREAEIKHARLAMLVSLRTLIARVDYSSKYYLPYSYNMYY